LLALFLFFAPETCTLESIGDVIGQLFALLLGGATFAQLDAPVTTPFWWDICQKAGAGAAVVLGPVAYLLWKDKQTEAELNRKAREADATYIREADKNTLKVLWELTSLLQTDGKDGERRHQELKDLMDAIRESQDYIKAHIDGTKSKPA
jgi:hypothetical protein